MGENTNKNLVGQQILTQVLSLINKNNFAGLVKKHNSDKYYKKFSSWTHFVTMMVGFFGRNDSVTEIVENNMIGCVGKLGHFDLKEVPPKAQ